MEELKPDFEVKLQSDAEPTGYTAEPRIISQEVQLLRQQVADLCRAVQALVKLQAIANQKLDTAITGNASFTVL